MELGTIVRGEDIGKERSRQYIRSACEDCGKERWVMLKQGRPRAIVCRSCMSKITAVQRGISIKRRYDDSEYKAHIVDTIRQRWQDPEYKRKVGLSISQALKGRPLSEKTKQGISLAQNRRFADPNERQKISDFWRGLWRSLEFRRYMSKIREGRIISEEQRRKQSLSMKGRQMCLGNKLTNEHKSNIRKAMLVYCRLPEARERLRNLSLKNWANQEWREKRIRQFVLSNQKRPTKPELKVLEAIRLFKLPYIYNGNNAGLIIGGRCPDFVNNNGIKTLIEVYGDYWHRNDDGEERKALFAEYGFRTLILWECHINASSSNDLAKEIKEFTESKYMC